MRMAGAADGVVRASGARIGPGSEIRCPACSRLLVLRSGPRVTPHFAHRPRQSCRDRPRRSTVGPLRLEQLTLFDLEPLEPLPAPAPPPIRPAPQRRRPRRRAWLPRLIRWLKARTGPS